MKTKEERFKELIGDLYTGDYTVKLTINKNKKVLEIYNIKDQLLIEQIDKLECIWVSNENIWMIIEKEYNITYTETRRFMKEMITKHFKIDYYSVY